MCTHACGQSAPLCVLNCSGGGGGGGGKVPEMDAIEAVVFVLFEVCFTSRLTL